MGNIYAQGVDPYEPDEFVHVAVPLRPVYDIIYGDDGGNGRNQADNDVECRGLPAHPIARHTAEYDERNCIYIFVTYETFQYRVRGNQQPGKEIGGI